MTPTSIVVDILVVAVSLAGSYGVSLRTIDDRMDKEREREKERWYVEAGIQADLASKEYSEEILSKTNTRNDSVQILRDRASELQEHAAEGRYLGVDETIAFALKEIAADHRFIAAKLDNDDPTDWSELTSFEDDMWKNVKIVSNFVPSETEYDSDSD